MTFRLAISVDSFPYIICAGELVLPSVSDDTKWTPAEDMPRGCGQVNALATPEGSWTETMVPLDGTLDAGGLSFVLHDVLVSYNGANVRLCSYLLGRDPASITSTVLTRTASEGELELEIPTIAASALTSGYPKVLYLGDEAIYCDSFSGGVVTVNPTGRGYYGSRARTYKYQADLGLYPEVWAEPPTIAGRRVILWAIEDGHAYAIWRGVVTRGPELQDSARWRIECDHIWTVEKNRSLGDPAVNARVVGYEPSAISVGIDCTNSFAGGSFDRGIRTWFGWNGGGAAPLGGDVPNGDSTENPDLFCDRLQRTLAARLQATALTGSSGTRAGAQTQVAVRVERSGRDVTLSVRCGNNGNAPELVARVLTKESRAAMKDEGGGIYSGSLTFELPPCALTFERSKINEVPLDYAIPISPRASSGGDFATEPRTARTWKDGAFRTVVRDVLAGDYDEQTRFVVYPTGRGVGRVAFVSRDGTPVRSANTETFAGYIAGSARVYFGGVHAFNGAPTLFLDRSVRLVYTQWVTCDHWIYGLQHALEDSTLSTESDPRNWDFSTAELVARVTAHEMSSREWYLDGSLKIGQLISDTLILDACGVVVRSGARLAIMPIRQPLAHWSQGYESSAIAATITRADLKQGSVPTWRRLNDSLVSSALIRSSLDEALVHDNRTRQKWGQRRTVDLALTGLPQARQGSSDGRSLGNRALARIIGLWGEPRFAVTFELTMDRLFGDGAIYGGDFVLLSEWNLPDGVGGRGLVNVPVQIYGREPSLDGASIRFHALLLPVAYGFAPCAKVNDLTNGYPSAGKCTLAFDTQYVNAGASDENDYSGGISTDLGSGWFKAGDKVALYLRDDTTGMREVSLTIESVSSGSVVVTPEVPLVPYDWDAAVVGGLWVDLTYDAASVQTDAGQKSFAFVGTGNAGDGTIVFSGDTQRSRKYSA